MTCLWPTSGCSFAHVGSVSHNKFHEDRDLIKAAQMSERCLVLGLRFGREAGVLTGWHKARAAGGKAKRNTSEPFASGAMCDLVQDVYESSETLWIQLRCFPLQHILMSSSNVLALIRNGERKRTHDFRQHFTQCRAPARQEKQENFSVEVLPLISN